MISFRDNACIDTEIVRQSLCASAAASALSVVVASWWAANALNSVPDVGGSGANLASSSGWVSVGQVVRAIARVGLQVPNCRGSASNALLGVDVVVRSSSTACTFSSVRIESESRRTALAFSSGVVIVSIRCASITTLGSLVPVVRGNTTHTEVTDSQVGSSSRADTTPVVSKG